MLIGHQQTISYVLLLLWAVGIVQADTGVDDRQRSRSFKVSARIDKGCLLGGESSDATSLGTIGFGNISSLDRNIDATSSKNAGSIIIKCTPNISVSIAIGSGANASASVSNGRYLVNGSTHESLRYQLYQDASYSNIWGDGVNGGMQKVITATGASVEHTVYARLFASNTLPTPGKYTDTLLVTITY